MDIGAPIRSLGKVDMKRLAAPLLAADEPAWNENVRRRQDYGLHEQARSTVLLTAEVAGWPAVDVTTQPGWARLAETAVPVMHHISRNWYPPGGMIIRAMA